MKRLTITGNLGRDPEVKLDEKGDRFVVFSVATPGGTKIKPKTDWIEVSCSGPLADYIITNVRKGYKVLVEGFPAVNARLNDKNEVIKSLRLYAHLLEIMCKKEDDLQKE